MARSLAAEWLNKPGNNVGVPPHKYSCGGKIIHPACERCRTEVLMSAFARERNKDLLETLSNIKVKVIDFAEQIQQSMKYMQEEIRKLKEHYEKPIGPTGSPGTGVSVSNDGGIR